jgi:hypothetical protein
MKGYCIVCSTEIEVFICCDGFMCGCMGQLAEPPVCSEKCYNELMNNFDDYCPKSKPNNDPYL